MSVLRIETARVFQPLLAPSRYKAAFGGRGSGKSHFFAGLLIEDALAEPGVTGEGLRSVCIREVQKDLAQSSKALIEKKLSDFRLGEADGFKVFRDQIATPKDGIIIFKGMQDYTADSIKSLEGFKRSWFEEAQTAAERSLTLLRPTLRAPGSELWFSWNPRFKHDPVDKLLRGEDLPSGAVVLRANWSDNPWFPEELERERGDCLRLQPDQYNHIWEGGYATVIAGAYYARQISEMKGSGRLGNVGPDPLMTYRAFWDLGGTGRTADATSIWIAQFVGREIRVLNYYEAQGQPLSTHVQWLRDNGYAKAKCILPHDGVKGDTVYDATPQGALESAGFEVDIVPNQGRGAAMQRVEAARRLFPLIWMNEPKCGGGLDALGAYHANIDEKRNVDLGPEHDWASHAADAFGLMCISYEGPKVKVKDAWADAWADKRKGGNSWMTA
jgi:phage terminase large subunit